ncbi:NADPH oxidase activator 1 isoform X2 [Desmodus rotundus]|uniref:NADPH oxidase activator 1 isoform X2 n=1 Tax=Desmodus rotundus TaxID=9430 RepID=UPI000D1854AD|nr:NADPH oxidase activator 1 isoform X2 [Desmodus rotundus]
MPSLGDLVLNWQRGVQAVACGDWGSALRLFSGVPGRPAKMCFNVGCVHLLAGDPEAALRAFDQAVAKDAYLAIGFFQRGVANFQLERSQEALSDFQLALVQLRGNAAIDYTQLGLRFKLQAWEVLFNVAAAQCGLGLWAEAACSLEEAISKGPGSARGDLDAALAQVQGLWQVRAARCGVGMGRASLQEQGPLQPRSVPRGEVFRPPRRHLEHLEPMDFLGKAKVVVASGIGPQQPQVLDQGGGARPRAGPRAHDTGPCRASMPLGIRTPPNAVTEVGSGRAGQADHRALASVSEQRPHLEQVGQQAPVGQLAAGQPDPKPSEDPVGAGGVAAGDRTHSVAVTVQCAFTLALEAPRGASLPSLRALLSEALPAQAQCGQLSYREPGDNGRWVPLPEEQVLQRAWWDVASGPAGLQLQCRAVGGRPVLCQVVAQHSYSAQRPEDLDPQPGDIMDVLCGGGAGSALSQSPAGASGAGGVCERTWHHALSPAVDQAWLEGHCDGHVGIFPKCFVVPAGHRV